MTRSTAVRPVQDSAPALVRPLGAFERVFHLWMERNPLHFSVVAQLDGVVAPADLQRALHQVQRRHPLLAVRVVDDAELGPAFHRSGAEVPVAVVDGAQTWQEVVAAEMARPFERGAAPLVRAVLQPVGGGSVLVLTFEHSVADGRSAVGVLGDVLAALNGGVLEEGSVPAAQEGLTARLPELSQAPDPSVAGERTPRVDARMGAVGSRRPFDGSLPSVASCALDTDLTQRLMQRCRVEGTTVHSAVCAAATQVAMRLRDLGFVRVMSPVDLRHLIDPGHDVGLYIGVARTGISAEQSGDLWDLARATQAALAPARSPQGVAAAAAAAAAYVPVHADAAAAEGFMLGGMSFEVDISNLGVLDLPGSGPLRATAVWGPVLLNQVEGEQVLGVTTFEGRLRMTGAGYGPVAPLLDGIQETLAQATSST